MVDYVIDLEFDSKRQPFLDALIDHPKLETFITATFDAARLVTKHRSTFSNKGEAYSALVRPIIILSEFQHLFFRKFN
jgi:hypothetical protein